MKRLLSFLCLIAALTGTQLRQIEAAHDLARSVAELGSGHRIEIIDGGVGDDSGETVVHAGAADHVAGATFLPADPEGLSPPLRPAPSDSGPGDRSRDDRTTSHPAGSVRRHAWLQRFLF